MSDKHAPIPPEVLAEAWHEYRYPRPSNYDPTPAFSRAMEVIAQWLRTQDGAS
jgi:hypothetical protein